MFPPSFGSFPERPPRVEPTQSAAAIPSSSSPSPAASSSTVPSFGSFPIKPSKPTHVEQDGRDHYAPVEESKHKRRSRDDKERSLALRDRKRSDSREQEYDHDRRSRKHRSWHDETASRPHHRSSRAGGRTVDPADAPRPPSSSSLIGHRLAFFKTPDYIVDSSGDPNNLRYGRMSSSDVPRYQLRGYGRIIGLPDAWRIARGDPRHPSAGKGLEIVLQRGEMSKKAGEEPLRVRASTEARRLRPRKAADGVEGMVKEDYILVSRSKLLHVRAAEEEGELPVYRSITRDKKIRESAESTSSEESEDDDLSESPDEILKRKIIDYERRTRADASDIDAWIELARLQNGRSGSTRTTTQSKRAEAEVALDILEDALKALPSNKLSIRLQRAALEAFAEVQEPAQVTRRWQSRLAMLEQHVGEVDDDDLMLFWLEYIDWRAGKGLRPRDETGGGGIDEVLQVYVDCIATTLARRTSSQARPARERHLVHLILRAALLMRSAGYEERGLATVQALLELNFFMPPRLAQCLEDEKGGSQPYAAPELLAELENFWDSEQPRIGEADAKGWRAWDDAQQMPEPRVGEVSAIGPTSQDPYVAWYEVERQIAERDRRPMRTTDITAEEDDDDPFRVVLFSDIRQFMVVFRSPLARSQLARGALVYLGLCDSVAKYENHLGTWAFAASEFARAQLWPDESLKASPTPSLSPAVRVWQSTAETLFGSSAGWFGILSAEDAKHIDVDFVRSVIRMLQPIMHDRSWSSISLAVEAASSAKGAAKIAKTWLATERNDVATWLDFCQILRKQGKIAEARQVYKTCMDAGAATEAAGRFKTTILAEWVDLEWEQGDLTRACQVAACLCTGETGANDLTSAPQLPTGPVLLKCRRHFASIPTPCDLDTLQISIVFELATRGFKSALDILRLHVQALASGSTEKELALQLGCKLLLRENLVKPEIWRSWLDYAIDEFTDNTVFLTLYLRNEANGRAYGRLQRLLHERILSREDCPAETFLWAGWAEGQLAARTFRSPHQGGAERVRAIFDKAVQAKSGQRSPAVWMAYIEFETLQERPQAAKSLCYRAVTHVGTCKDLYMMPFSPRLRPHFSPQELRSWATLMIETGIRVRRPFDRFFQMSEESLTVEMNERAADPMAALDEGDDTDTGMEGADDLGFLRERKRLMPY